ncbi:MAG: hypothetical protein IPK57_10790 [Chitinophagaceae bacterium]|nr:hypothetical protein [Chitinophagaceae bacterium]
MLQRITKTKTRTWKVGSKGSVANVSTADLIKEKAITDGIHKMVYSNYKPIGCQISYNSVFGKSMASGQTWIADPYYYSMYILRFLCDEQSKDKTKYYVDYSTPTTVTITANAMFALNLYAADLGDDFRGYLKLTKKPEKKNGYYFMGKKGRLQLTDI